MLLRVTIILIVATTILHLSSNANDTWDFKMISILASDLIAKNVEETYRKQV